MLKCKNLKEITKKMSKISEPGYLFIHSGVLEKEQIDKCFQDLIEQLISLNPEEYKDIKFLINVVKNKEGVKYGHSYGWINKKDVFNALLGKNLDGSERIEYIDDENWEPPKEDYYEAMKKAGDDWGDQADIEKKYKRPKIKIELDPLISLSAIEYTEDQYNEVKKESKYGFMELFETKLSHKTGKLNTLFSNDIPSWIDEKYLFDFFKKFEKNKDQHYDKKTKKKFCYPVVKIKSKKELRDVRRFCTITFSTLNPKTASFLINVVKRLEFENEGKKYLLFFSQSRDRGND